MVLVGSKVKEGLVRVGLGGIKGRVMDMISRWVVGEGGEEGGGGKCVCGVSVWYF